MIQPGTLTMDLQTAKEMGQKLIFDLSDPNAQFWDDEKCINRIDSGADLTQTIWDKTALHYTVTNGRLKVAKHLIEKGAVVDARDASGNTPLFEAAIQGRRPVMELLIEHGADVHALNVVGSTALHVAAHYRQFFTAQELIKQGIDLFVVNKEGHTALDLAYHAKCDSIITLIKETLKERERMVEAASSPALRRPLPKPRQLKVVS